MRKMFLATAAAVALLATGAASAEPACHNAHEMAAMLASKYSEAPVAFGLQTDGWLLTVFSGKDSWTVVRTSPVTMLSCIVAAGKGEWQAIVILKGDPA